MRRFGGIALVVWMLASMGGRPAMSESPLETQCKAKAQPEAVAACTQIIERRGIDEEEKALALMWRGDAFRHQERKREALADYKDAHVLAEKAMNLPLFRMTALEAGLLAFDMKEYAYASFKLGRAIDEDDKDKERSAKLRFMVGVAAANIEIFDIAIENFDDAIKLSPRYADAFRERGIMQLIKKNRGAAMRDLNRAIALNGNDAKAFRFRARVHAQRGNRALATADLKKALEIAPGDANAQKDMREFEAAGRR